MAQQVGKCVICGKEFVKKGNMKTCSLECSKENAINNTAKFHGYNYEPFKYRCVMCGKEYFSKRKKSKTCSTECAKAYQRANCKEIYPYIPPDEAIEHTEKRKVVRRSSWEIERDNNKDYNKHEKKSTACIVDINQKARELGLSYGQYVARYGI